MDGIKHLKKIQTLIVVALTLAVISLFASVIKNIVVERWAKSRDKFACVPADTTTSYPVVYGQTASNPVQDDALIKAFVENYIRFSQDEQIINYHALSNNGRYQNAQLSDAKLKAIEMSLDGSPERALNMKRYADSNDTFNILKKCNCGWIFLIDDILILPDIKSGTIVAVVRGEFQVTYDKVKAELPDQLWGYREIVLNIYTGVPTKDSSDNFLNKNGFFVGSSYTRQLSASDRSDFNSRSADFYMKGNNE